MQRWVIPGCPFLLGSHTRCTTSMRLCQSLTIFFLQPP
jgi:hypothetical protein